LSNIHKNSTIPFDSSIPWLDEELLMFPKPASLISGVTAREEKKEGQKHRVKGANTEKEEDG